MKVLGIDTACTACSVAVVSHDGGPGDGSVLAAEAAAMTRGQAEALMPMAESAMAAAGLRLADLDLIAVTVGPGSFTGLRTGLAAARGLGLALDIPVAGVTTLEAVAQAAGREHPLLPVLVALETRRSDLYVQRFDSDLSPATDPQALPPDAALGLLPADGAVLAGDGADRLIGAADQAARTAIAARSAAAVPDAAVVAAIAARRVSAPLAAAPLYVHAPAVRRPASAQPAGLAS